MGGRGVQKPGGIARLLACCNLVFMPVGSQSARRLEVLKATGLLDSPADPEFDELTRLLSKSLKAPVALVSLVDEARQFFKSAYGLAEPWASRRETPLSHSFCQHAVRTRKALVIDDAREHPLVRENLAIRELGVIAYAGVPITLDGEAIGAFCAIDGRARHWTEDELEVLTLLGASLERLIRLQVTNDALARKTAELDTLIESLDDALVACDEHGKLTVWNRAATQLLGDGEDLPPEQRSVHYGVYLPDQHTLCPPDQAPLTRALRGEHVRDALLFVRAPAASEGRWHRVNASPMIDANGKMRGAVSVGRDVTPMHELHEQLREASIRDSLTGLHNRRGFMVLAEQAIKASLRERHRLALFFVDLNGMKAINDRLGHEVGDQALIEAAGLLRRTFREMDIVARLGGDEFVALTAEVPPDIAKVLGERLRANVAAHAQEDPSRPYRLSLSVGVSTYDPEAPKTLAALLAEADQLMYQRKRQRQRERSGTHVRPPDGSSREPH
jgi:diguanylate cyclase (GGDEF)-like protein